MEIGRSEPATFEIDRAPRTRFREFTDEWLWVRAVKKHSVEKRCDDHFNLFALGESTCVHKPEIDLGVLASCLGTIIRVRVGPEFTVALELKACRAPLEAVCSSSGVALLKT